MIIATYNIAGGHPSFDFNKITDFLQTINCDILCLQEVYEIKSDIDTVKPYTQAHYIADNLSMNCNFVKAINTDKGQYGIAVLSKHAMHSIRYIELPRGSLLTDEKTRMPGANERRMALSGIISPIDKPEFLLICTHFGIYNTFDQKEEVSLEPISRIHDFLIKPQHANLPKLLMGDLNALPDSNTISKLKEYLNVTITTKTTKKHTIDYIFYESLNAYSVIYKPMLTYNDTNYTSDHLPVIAEWIAN